MSSDTEALVSKCREKYKLIASLEKERDYHKDEAKSFEKQIGNHEAEIRRLITETNQTELVLAPAEKCSDCGEAFTEENRSALTDAAGGPLCHTCAAKQVAGEPDEADLTLPNPPA